MESTFQPSTANVILGALLAVSEILSLTRLKSNGIFQLAVNVLKSLNFTGKSGTKEEAEN